MSTHHTTCEHRPFPIIGSVSSGTMRHEDLYSAFLDTLRYLRDYNASCYSDEMPANSEDVLDALIDDLNTAAPEGFYFGAHPGDDADYGFWLFDEWLERYGTYDDDEHKLDSLDSSIHANQLVVNDHGNCTFYVWCDRCQSHYELWSIV